MQTIPNDEVNEREEAEDGSMSLNDSFELQLKDSASEDKLDYHLR